MLEQLIELFPELDREDVEDAVNDADGQAQELMGQLMTLALAPAVGLSEAEVAERLDQIDWPEDWDMSQ